MELGVPATFMLRVSLNAVRLAVASVVAFGVSSVAVAEPQFELLHTFQPAGVVRPVTALIQSSDGSFYGTTPASGPTFGTVFKMTQGGTVTVLHVFLGGFD